ncbi:MAG: hypothetical protein F6J93_01940 [Oscillatoria sp. SIO1A7]|nr:hypothetical protein [Oscillatoria sp. SIO1A7]
MAKKFFSTEQSRDAGQSIATWRAAALPGHITDPDPCCHRNHYRYRAVMVAMDNPRKKV